jgi:hypothetical protein
MDLHKPISLAMFGSILKHQQNDRFCTKTRVIHCALEVCFSFLVIPLNYILYPYCAAYWRIEQVYHYQRTESMCNFCDLKIWRDVGMRCQSKIQSMKAIILPKGACTCRKFTSTLILKYL